MKRFYIETFGCQMNAHDSEKVIGTLVGRGYEQVATPDAAELIMYNTCSIRDKAEQKVFARLQDFKRQHAGKTFAVIGCVAQQEGEKIFEKAPHVSMVVGSASYNKLPELLVQIEMGNKRVTGLSLDTEDTFETPLTRRDNPHKAYITIIEGCNKACAYCVVPFTRGPERSRTLESVLREARELVDMGYTEIQLLGQNVNSFRDTSIPGSAMGHDFAYLLRRIGEVDGLRRVRFTTSHPRDFVKDIVDAIDENPVLCNHIHLPVQSGSTTVLDRMQRNYTRDEYLRRLGWMQNAKRQIDITTDVIVGFPGETEAEFEDTMSLVDRAGYESMYIFKYSRRPNTPALRYEDHITEDEKTRRFMMLQEKQRALQIRQNAELLGTVENLLVEGWNAATNQWIGKTSQNRTLNFVHPAGREADLLGKYANAIVTRTGAGSMGGEAVA